jgi:hypothetical protein
MKNILLFFVIAAASNILILAQGKQTTLDEKTGKSMFVGSVNVNDFQDTAYAEWWNSGYENYTPDSVLLGKLNGKLDSVSITIVMGTWCSDSRREVPRFYKILDLLKYPADKIKLICVDRKKKALKEESDSLEIELVPTFIFYRQQEEIGRIIESPEASLESDMLEITE